MDGQPPVSHTDKPGSLDEAGAGSIEEKPAVRRLWWVWSLLALVVLIVGAFAATRSALLDVDEVLVDGVGGRLDRSLVVEVSEIRKGEPMVGVSSETAARRVATLPWVAEAKVTRDWPGTVRIWFMERQAAVNAVDLMGRWALLDSSATVLEIPVIPEADLPTIRVDRLGPEGTRITGVGALLEAASAVTADLRAWIVALVPTGSGVRAELVGGVGADLGRGDDYRDEMRSLATVLSRVVLGCVVSIDVSIHENPVVRRDEVRCG
ncbi:MAG: FtsQ-type POTRA domain-containing protein [Actinomycetota bacterium]|nr:FtsQ-type POTRA domain-containing protein [Actinomycetota bacterium]